MLLATVGFIAGFIDTLAGGGGLITIPAFLFAGLSPGQALATNKCQAFAGTLTVSLKLMVSGHLKVRSLWPYATFAFGMALLGAWTLREVSEADWLERAVPLLLLLAAGYFGFVRLPWASLKAIPVFGIFAVAGIASIGFYDGFFGPGTGSFFVLTFIIIKGANIMQSTAITKLLNFASNFAAFIIFALQGYVIWYLGLVMAVAQIAGAFTGSRFAIRNGEKVVRPVLVIVSILLSLRILLG